jgi:hypothetical protein
VLALGLGLCLLRSLLQRRPIRQSHDVFDPCELIEEIEHLGCAEASIEPDADPSLRKRRSHLRKQSLENRHQPQRGSCISRAKDRTQGLLLRLSVELDRAHQGEEAVGLVVAVVEAERLLAVGRVHGGVEVERDDLRSPAETTPVTVEDRIGDGLDESVELHRARRVFETRNRRLRGQPVSVDGVAPDEHLVDGIVGELVAVATIGVPQGDRKQSLLDELGETVADLARLSPIAKALGDRFAQSELLIDGLEQQGTAVRAAVLLVEAGHDGLRNQIGKGNRVCDRIGHYEEALLA